MTDITFFFDSMTYLPGIYFLVVFLTGRWSPLDSMFLSFWICWWFVIIVDWLIPSRVLSIEEIKEKYPELYEKHYKDAEICENTDKEELK